MDSNPDQGKATSWTPEMESALDKATSQKWEDPAPAPTPSEATPTAPDPTPAKADDPNQPEPMPSSNQSQTEGEAPADTSAVAHDENLTLPEGTTDRTREQFDKLKARLRDAEQRLATQSTPQPDPKAEYGNSVFDSFRPKAPEAPAVPPVPQVPPANIEFLNQKQVESITNQFVDQYGNVDVNALNRTLIEANKRAQDAETRARSAMQSIERFEEKQEVREAHTVHPELDPANKDKFDKNFFELVRAKTLQDRFLSGQPKSLLQIANEVKTSYKPSAPVNLDKVREEAVSQYKQTLAQREQGPLEAGKGEPRQTFGDLANLRQRTRQGDGAALDERLRKAGVL